MNPCIDLHLASPPQLNEKQQKELEKRETGSAGNTSALTEEMKVVELEKQIDKLRQTMDAEYNVNYFLLGL